MDHLAGNVMMKTGAHCASCMLKRLHLSASVLYYLLKKKMRAEVMEVWKCVGVVCKCEGRECGVILRWDMVEPK